MKVKFYGVRGSYPVPGPSTIKYGGNTTCVSFTTDVGNGKVSRIIIDSGTGITQLGKEIIGNFFAKKEDLDINILFSHLHPDHVQGLPFFAPVYFKTATINMFGMKALGSGIEDALVAQMSPPTFPIEYFSLKSNRNHLVVYDGDTLDFLGFKVSVMQAYAPSHPQQGATYYRVTETSTGKSVACIWDNESKVGGDKAVINFSKNCDVLIHDTQYTQEEYESDKMIVQGYGHSTYDMAIENAKQAGVHKLVCTHFNPAHSDEKLDEIQEKLMGEYISFGEGLPIVLAQEGMEIEV
jgi:phosphoribosyl 1,2-cyclic phosphodiesterase